MSRRTTRAAGEAAAQAASEAARTLQARGQEAKAEASVEPKTEVIHSDPGFHEKMLKSRQHVQAMDEILEKRGLNKDPEEKKEAPKEEPKLEEPAPKEEVAEVAAEPKGEDTPAAVPPEEPKPEIKNVRVKVDGEEFDVPQTEIDEAGGLGPYRMNRAAENRLRKANEVLARAHQFQQPRQEQRPQQSAEQFIAEQMDIIRFGTKEEGAKAFLAIQARSQRPQIDPYAMQTEIEERMRNQSGVAKFKEEFADIAKDPILWRTAQSMDLERRSELAKANVPFGSVDWVNEYRTIGNKIKSAFGRSSQPSSVQATGNSSQSKEAKKASTANVVSLPSASVRAEGPKEEKPETRDEMLASMKRARGQTTG